MITAQEDGMVHHVVDVHLQPGMYIRSLGGTAAWKQAPLGASISGSPVSPPLSWLLRRCSQGVLFADLLLGCMHALHVVAKAVEQVDRG